MREGMGLNRLDQGELDDFEEFRQGMFLYFCQKCVRSFDSREAVDSCRFCGSGLKELKAAGKPSKAEKAVRYFCIACDKIFVAEKKPEICEMCGSKFIHSYEWQRLRRDVLRTKLGKIFARVRHFERYQKTGKKESTGPKFTMPSMQKLRLPKMQFPKLRLFRDEEEMPTR